jgi:hypothetical protein
VASLPLEAAADVRAAVWVGAAGARRAAGVVGGAGGGESRGAIAGAAGGGVMLAGARAAIDGAAGGATGRGGVLALCGTARIDGALGAAGGLAAMTGGAGGVARGTIGLRRALGCTALAGAGRAVAARFICDGGFSLKPLEIGAKPARGRAGAAGANRALPRRVMPRCVLPLRPAFGISRERMVGRSICGTFRCVPSASRTLRSTDTEPEWRCACAVCGVISAMVRKANAAAAKPCGATAAMCRANLGAIISNPNNERVSEPDRQAPDGAT